MKIETQVLNVPIEDIIPNRFQPRLNFDENGLQELAASIKEHGIIQPLVLRRIGDKYEIIAGERRYKASKLAGLTQVPAIITAMDDMKSAEVAIVENVQRRDLSSIEEAKSYKALLDKGFLTQEELAKKMGLSQSAISNKMRLLSLSDVVQKALMEGKISERHARSLLQLETSEEQEKWLNKIIDERLTVKDLDKKLKELNKDKPKKQEEKNNKEEILMPNQEEMPIIKANFGQMPNKFFNFLEDEEINMDVSDPETLEDDIELLDVTPVETIDTSVSNNLKNMEIANNLIDKLSVDLKNNNYKIIIDKTETDNDIKYTIIIDKTDE